MTFNNHRLMIMFHSVYLQDNYFVHCQRIGYELIE